MIQQIIRVVKMQRLKKIYHQSSKIAVIDIEKQNRFSKVILLYSKGLNQEKV